MTKVTLPVLRNHDPAKAIGVVESNEDGELVVSLAEPMERTAFFDVFGNAGMQIIEGEERDGKLWFKRARFVLFASGAPA